MYRDTSSVDSLISGTLINVNIPAITSTESDLFIANSISNIPYTGRIV